ncbi:Piso0_002179 [Millerozyma farinosa CBS 7064]|uniref:Piso0_002179 protein n=1 Tax=Pichia sorbitophila (strain ATCC MYA-4447 / BCRC 22081 / CBS 7064 / NBRC 10061 / NRRL Y-12695) TaxID=559304 RepID=G8YEC1_PICSO|nr:Piso0_002179 [Millerozyma farinosa CBS 7064]
MAEPSNPLNGPINKVRDILTEFCSEASKEDKCFVTEISNFEKFQTILEKVETFIGEQQFNYGLSQDQVSQLSELGEGKESDDAPSSDSTRQEIEEFNKHLDDKTKNFISLLGFEKTADGFLSDFIAEEKLLRGEDTESLERTTFCEHQLTQEGFHAVNSLCVLLDLQIHFVLHHDATSKTNFYNMVSFVSESLFNISTKATEIFWCYLEARQALIKESIFDKGSTSDRISMLEICNTITDRFAGEGQKDPANKDTFNDSLQYRVRIFLSNILNFEDNTGLNKYFLTSNRSLFDLTSASRGRDDEFIRDIIQINKLFRDPYHFLKPMFHKQLIRLADILKRVYEYLIEEEIKWAKISPKIDQFAVKAPKSEQELEEFKQKYAEKPYFAEELPLSSFEPNRRGPSFEKARKDDMSFLSKLFDESKQRQLYLVQIYFLCNLYYELNSSNRKDFLKSLHPTANLKHIIDDAPPDNIVSVFFRIKRDMPKRYRSIDTQFAFLLQHTSISETYWWGWLIYGKDADTGKSLFVDRKLNSSELLDVANRFETTLPYKTKPYFNVYVTPQLSRKMKIQTGLENLEAQDDSEDATQEKFQSAINELDTTLNENIDQNSLSDAHARKSLLFWKKMNLVRKDKWLAFGSLVNKDMFQVTQNKSTDEKNESNKNNVNAAVADNGDNGDGSTTSTKRPLEDDEASDVPAAKKTKS